MEQKLKVSLIEPNGTQPRKNFDEAALQELADSIKTYGVLQPLIVQKKDSHYEIIAGERRWRAAKLAGLTEVPVMIREYDKQKTMEIALIENVQRADLNPIEEAQAYQRLIQEFHLTQEEIAARVSKNRATVTNSMRLLKLDDRVQQLLIDEKISSGHARALLGLENGTPVPDCPENRRGKIKRPRCGEAGEALKPPGEAKERSGNGAGHQSDLPADRGQAEVHYGH